MEIKDESLLKEIEAIKQSAIKTSNNELYIPLKGKRTTNPEEEPFDLAEKISSFFVFNETSKNDPKIMLMLFQFHFILSVKSHDSCQSKGSSRNQSLSLSGLILLIH